MTTQGFQGRQLLNFQCISKKSSGNNLLITNTIYIQAKQKPSSPLQCSTIQKDVCCLIRDLLL